jgi:hypothetical protein
MLHDIIMKFHIIFLTKYSSSRTMNLSRPQPTVVCRTMLLSDRGFLQCFKKKKKRKTSRSFRDNEEKEREK